MGRRSSRLALAALLAVSRARAGGVAVDPSAPPPPAARREEPEADRLIPAESPVPMPAAPTEAEIDRLLRALSDDDFRRREDAQRALERRCAAHPVRILSAIARAAEAGEDLEARVRCEDLFRRIAEELDGTIVHGRSTEAEIAWLLSRPEEGLRIAGIEAVRIGRRTSLAPRVREIFLGSESFFLRSAARGCLTELGAGDDLEDPADPAVRRARIARMARSQDAESSGRIRAGLKDPHPTVRREALRALSARGEIPSGEAAPFLSDPSPLVQEEAARALREALKAPWKDASLLEEARAWEASRAKLPATTK